MNSKTYQNLKIREKKNLSELKNISIAIQKRIKDKPRVFRIDQIDSYFRQFQLTNREEHKHSVLDRLMSKDNLTRELRNYRSRTPNPAPSEMTLVPDQSIETKFDQSTLEADPSSLGEAPKPDPKPIHVIMTHKLGNPRVDPRLETIRPQPRPSNSLRLRNLHNLKMSQE